MMKVLKIMTKHEGIELGSFSAVIPAFCGEIEMPKVMTKHEGLEPGSIL